jgi:ABC-type transport system substrate-binding protein
MRKSVILFLVISLLLAVSAFGAGKGEDGAAAEMLRKTLIVASVDSVTTWDPSASYSPRSPISPISTRG